MARRPKRRVGPVRSNGANLPALFLAAGPQVRGGGRSEIERAKSCSQLQGVGACDLRALSVTVADCIDPTIWFITGTNSFQSSARALNTIDRYAGPSLMKTCWCRARSAKVDGRRDRVRKPVGND